MAQVTLVSSSSTSAHDNFCKKRRTDDDDGNGDRKRKVPIDSATHVEDIGRDPEDLSSNTTLLSGISLMKLKRYGVGIELLKLPRFGAKLSAAPGDLERLNQRLNKIYKSKLQAFTWPRYREIVLTDGAEGATKKQSEGFVGRLNSAEMTVEMTHFRGTFSAYFGRHFVDRDGEPRTMLSPFETFFLMDMGTLEVNLSETCVLAVEDVRAMMEAKVANFGRRYALFSEIHRATQLYAKNYGSLTRSSLKAKKPRKSGGNRWEKFDSESERPTAQNPNSNFKATSSLLPILLPDVNITEAKDRRTDRAWRSVEEARKILGMEEIPSKKKRNCPTTPEEESIEIPPFCFLANNYPHGRCWADHGVTSDVLADGLDVAFTCFSKISAIGATTPQFDVAVMDFRRRDIPIADLFSALITRSDPNLALYVAKEDMGQLNGFAAVLADIPTVQYQGASDNS